MAELKNTFVSLKDTMEDVLRCINMNGQGIVLVVEPDRRILDLLTDGDVRRAVLSGLSLNTTVKELLKKKDANHRPITAKAGTPKQQLIEIARKNEVVRIPLLDESDIVVGLFGIHDILKPTPLPMQAVVMAGGYGTRLHPLTNDTPKPMLPMGDRPIMERIINRLSSVGIEKVHVTTHYLKEQITEHFGTGDRFGVDLKYVTEEASLGTAGGLSLMETPDSPLLVINGDILTDVDFGAMFEFHKENNASLTMAVRRYIEEVPYGVVQCDGPYVCKLVEKPTHTYLVNAGIYLMEPDTHRKIPKNTRFDMTDLIQELLGSGERVVSFPVWEYWRDIGQHDDYAQAQEDLKNGKLKS